MQIGYDESIGCAEAPESNYSTQSVRETIHSHSTIFNKRKFTREIVIFIFREKDE